MEKINVLVRAPILSLSGYGVHARYLVRALEEKENVELFLITTPWGQTGWLYEDTEERKWIDERIKATAERLQQGLGFDVSVQVTIPGEWEQLAPINIGVTAGIETDKISEEWVKKCYMMDRIIVPSEHAKSGFDATYMAMNQQAGELMELKCPCPVDVVPYPVFEVEQEKLKKEIDFEYDFNYLLVAQWGPRKNIQQAIEGFIEEHYNHEVGLVVKASIKNNSIIDRDFTFNQMQNFITNISNKYENKKCKIYLLHGHMSDGEMLSLYNHPKIKVLINLSHGEGFGLPMFEAASQGLPVITPFWSGQVDFLQAPVKKKNKKKGKMETVMKPLCAKVKYEIKPVQENAVWKTVIEPDMMWAYPKIESYRQRLRELYENYGFYEGQAKKLQKHILKNYKQEDLYKKFADTVLTEDIMAPFYAQSMNELVGATLVDKDLSEDG